MRQSQRLLTGLSAESVQQKTFSRRDAHLTVAAATDNQNALNILIQDKKDRPLLGARPTVGTYSPRDSTQSNLSNRHPD